MNLLRRFWRFLWKKPILPAPPPEGTITAILSEIDALELPNYRGTIFNVTCDIPGKYIPYRGVVVPQHETSEYVFLPSPRDLGGGVLRKSPSGVEPAEEWMSDAGPVGKP